MSHQGQSFLNDIVVDPDDSFAFISDSKAGKIIAYSLKSDSSWSIEHSSMKASPKVSVEYCNKNYRLIDEKSHHVLISFDDCISGLEICLC